MLKEREMVYWTNVNVPDMQYRSNGVSCWKRKQGETSWKYHEGLVPAFPSPWRKQMDESFKTVLVDCTETDLGINELTDDFLKKP